MTSRHIFVFVAFAIFLVAPFCFAKQPNILWIVSEDNGPFLGCYGDANAHTPNLDKLASEGVLYLNAFANAPVCAPSRSTLITGMYASTLGTQNMRSRYPIPHEFTFYCQEMRKAGYYCMNPGKTDYNIAGNDKKPWDKGKSWDDSPAGKPWMLVLNTSTTHESCLHKSKIVDEYVKTPFPVPPYQPDTPAIHSNWVEYYHDTTKMDAEYGKVLDALAADGLADDTIVFYFSDHGGILPRSKRFVLDSGLRVPLIIRFGKNVQEFAPAAPGSKLDRLVSFVDIAPTLLSMAGANKMPEQYQGKAFLGPRAREPREFVFGFRGRMDERIDLSFTMRDERYRLIHNYYPHRIYGMHLDYLWKMPATVSWEEEYLAGRCNPAQSAFWREKPTEELYDESSDPYEIHNLIDDPGLAPVAQKLRKALRDQQIENRDAAFIPESQLAEMARSAGSAYAATHEPAKYPIERIVDAADVASRRDAKDVVKLIEWAKDGNQTVRYWAAVGCCVRGSSAKDAALAMEALSKDSSPAVRIAADEALVRFGQSEKLYALIDEMADEKGDPLLAVNTVEALGDLARPAAKELIARVKAGLPAVGKMDGERGASYTERAGASLLRMLEEKK
ncbi:MAG TPA: sulfatase-like hydrolase/transferase [Tepidisphaeraceae bacterium]|nr:sulfatase-like hydrolase/transferase [Tepidisphaeraceae bacterium]